MDTGHHPRRRTVDGAHHRDPDRRGELRRRGQQSAAEPLLGVAHPLGRGDRQRPVRRREGGALDDERREHRTSTPRLVARFGQRMPTVTLRQPERDGPVRRTVQPVVPPRVAYDARTTEAL